MTLYNYLTSHGVFRVEKVLTWNMRGIRCQPDGDAARSSLRFFVCFYSVSHKKIAEWYLQKVHYRFV